MKRVRRAQERSSGWLAAILHAAKWQGEDAQGPGVFAVHLCGGSGDRQEGMGDNSVYSDPTIKGTYVHDHTHTNTHACIHDVCV
ncbi:hypothetical protein EON65_52870 [archaeon]|nr:MAG: hypothetical protein EON65_52870 [archaeon]